jgi:hypothetical protein
MKSPHDVAAAKSGLLDELERRVGRFARGADLSGRYASKLHNWLAERHGDDQRFERLIDVLCRYPAAVGQAEARDACHELLSAVRRDVEGERFPWRGVADHGRAAWQRAFGPPTPGVDVSGACPLCEQPTLRRYFRAYRAEVGGSWEWCGSCFSYEHHRALVPAWWDGERLLDVVPMSLLEHSPEFLERALRLSRDDAGSGRREGDGR